MSISTDGVTPSGNSATIHESWAAIDEASDVWFDYGQGGLSNSTSHKTAGASSGSNSEVISTTFDQTHQYKARTSWLGQSGATLSFLSFAQSPSTGVPSSSAILAHSATIACTFNANVVESSFDLAMQYRKFGDTTWIDAGAHTSSGSSISRDIVGLLGNTTYEFRLSGTRSTANTPNIVSSTSTFTTPSDVPTIETDAATSISSNGADLNGATNPNTLGVRVRFGWGTSDGGSVAGSWANLTAYQTFSGSGLQAFDLVISGLLSATGYFYRAFIEYPSPGFASGASGVSVAFTTAADPLVAAPLEDHMHLPIFDAQFGVQSTIYFTLSSPATISSDRLVTTAPGTLFASGDIKIIKDGGASANATNAATQPNASQPLYALVLTATECQAEVITVQIVDQNGPAFRDLYILVRTKQRLGQVLLNASQIGSSAPAMSLQPSSGGYSIDAQDSAGTNIGKIRGFLESMSLRVGTLQAGGAATATLDSSASATNNYYNGDILLLVGGTGVGQSRVITAYDGTTKISTVNASWTTNPDSTTRYVIQQGSRTIDQPQAELASIPAAGASLGLKIQFIFQRFAFKVTQTATIQTLFNSSGSSLGTRSVSDDGTTQSIAKVT